MLEQKVWDAGWGCGRASGSAPIPRLKQPGNRWHGEVDATSPLLRGLEAIPYPIDHAGVRVQYSDSDQAEDDERKLRENSAKAERPEYGEKADLYNP